MARSYCAGRTRGFTLVEAVVASALAAVVLLSLNGVLLMAARAMPGRTDSGQSAEAARAGRWLADDLRYAIEVTSFGPLSITVKAPDRDGDGVAESIEYSWSGLTGDPVLRRVNGSTGEPMFVAGANGISGGLDLTRELEAVTSGATTASISTETTLGSFAPTIAGAAELVATSTWLGQHVPVGLPASATGYNVDRVELLLARSGVATGVTRVQIREARSGLPTARILAEALVDELNLATSEVWTSVPFTPPASVSAGQPVCIVLALESRSPSAAWTQQTVLVPASAGAALSSVDGGASWTRPSGRAFGYRLLGRVTSASVSANVTSQRYLSVTAMLGGRRTVVEMLNRPVVIAPVVAPPSVTGPGSVGKAGATGTGQDWQP